VPFELGREREYLGSPLVVARALAEGSDYSVSHASAMGIHRMMTQPQLVVYATSPKAIRPRTVLGTEFRSVKNPNGAEEIAHRTPQEIMDEIAKLSAESAEVLGKIRVLFQGETNHD
jgi:hypothetical protein